MHDQTNRNQHLTKSTAALYNSSKVTPNWHYVVPGTIFQTILFTSR